MEKRDKAPPVSSNTPSQFAWSGPFQLLSDEGLRVVRSIVSREKHRLASRITASNTMQWKCIFCIFRAVASVRGSKQSLRGLYYSSPFLRDLQNCPHLLSMFENLVGEPLLPHFCFSNSPQVCEVYDFLRLTRCLVSDTKVALFGKVKVQNNQKQSK